ncbi:MAG: GIY-YIG nuclease family protein [Anaerolineae bacterium]|nr:GIY-YIG nuclease family protein [Anaerolineae bacterium]
MRVVINQALLNRNKRISHALFFISLAGMGIGFFYTWTRPAESTQISCLLLPALLLMTISSVRMANIWIREPRPADVLATALKGFGHKYTLFHYLLPGQHLLFGPEGVFVIKTLWHEREYRVVGSRWIGDQGLMRRLFGYMRQDLIGNPFQEVEYEVRETQRVLNKVLGDNDIEIQPLVVFINPNARFESEDPVYPVLYADSKRKPSLRQYLRDQRNAGRTALTIEDMDKLDVAYGLITRQELEGVDIDLDEDESSIDDDITVEEEETVDEKQPADVSALQHDRDRGMVYVIKGGQLYNIGMTRGTIDERLEALDAAAPYDLELVTTIEVSKPDAYLEKLHRKYERKRQKGEWFGLSKKDIDWLQAESAASGSDAPEDETALEAE